MATIPDANPRHVRKTVALDGSANNGNLGDDVTLFTITGRVMVVYISPYVSEALVCAAPTGVVMALAGAGHASGWYVEQLCNGVDFTGATGFMNPDDGINAANRSINYAPVVLAANLVLAVEDLGAGADITDGTIIFDLWYLPITDDGALAGDDIDTGRIPVNATAISGDTTAADRLEALMDGIVPGIVGASSTVTSVANCTGFTEATNDHFNGRLITFLTGNLAGQQCQITDYTGSTQTFTVTPLTEAPASSDTFVIH